MVREATYAPAVTSFLTHPFVYYKQDKRQLMVITRSAIIHLFALDILLVLSSHSVVLAPSKQLEASNGSQAIVTTEHF